MKMNLPNKLTTLRFALVPVFIFFMEFPKVAGEYSVLLATIVFAVASFTDFLDGSIARKYNLVTDFGKFMDPLADKVLTITAMIYLMVNGMCDPVVLTIVLAREFAVSGIRMIAATSAGGGKVIAASIWGKAKTVLQMVTIIFGLAAQSLYDLHIINENTFDMCFLGTYIAMWLVALITVVSGMQYILPNLDLIKNAK